MEPKIFSVEEANNALPKIKKILSELRHLRETIESKKVEMDLLEIVGVSKKDSVSQKTGMSKEMEMLNQLAVTFNRHLETLENLGCQVKDLNQGLVDFFTVRDGKLAYLCWKEGENTIQFWHSLEGGFRGRKPL